jgi:hypothetical protein
MPLTLLAKLEAARESALGFRTELADSPIHLERAEAALRTFDRARDELRKEAPNFHEEKGILAGLKLSGPIIRQHQEITKNAIRDELLDAEVGKEMVKVLARAAESLVQAVEKKTEDIQRKAGKLDGVHWAAKDALEQIADVLRHYASARRQEEDEDWSGRGAAKVAGGSGSGGGNGKSADVVDLADARGGKNGKKKVAKKKATRKKGTTKRAPRKKTAKEPEAPKEN